MRRWRAFVGGWLAVVCAIGVTGCLTNAQAATDLAVWTLEDKVAQLLFWGTPENAATLAKLMEGDSTSGRSPLPLGGVFLRSKKDRAIEEVRGLARYLRERAPGHVAPFLAADQEGGEIVALAQEVRVTPTARVLGTLDPPAIYGWVEGMAHDTHAAGIDMIFGPVIDVDGDPPNPALDKKQRAFGDDPVRVGEAGHMFGRALLDAGIIPVFKHFPGHGSALTDSHKELPRVALDYDAWTRGERVPYDIVFDSLTLTGAGAPRAVMVAHLAWPALTGDLEPTGFSRTLIAEELRKRYLWEDGLVVSDDLLMRAITDPVAAAVRMRRAGVDLLLVSRDEALLRRIHATLVEAYRSGNLPMAELDASVTRILKAKGWIAARRAPLDMMAL